MHSCTLNSFRCARSIRVRSVDLCARARPGPRDVRRKMAGYEKHMHAKFVMEETFLKLYHAKQHAAFQAWVENAGMHREEVHKNPWQTLLENVVRLFRDVYIGKLRKGDKKSVALLTEFLLHGKCVGGLHHTFKRLNDAAIKDIISGSTFLQLASGQLVRNCLQGQRPANFFYIIVKGKIDLYKQDEMQIVTQNLDAVRRDPQQIHTADIGVLSATLQDSESFGEQDMILNHPQSFTGIASVPSLLFAIPRPMFYKHMIRFYKDLTETFEKTEFLNKVPMFCKLGNARLLRLSKLLKPFSRAGNYCLLRHGAPADQVIFINSGQVRVTLDPNSAHALSLLPDDKRRKILEEELEATNRMMIGQHRVDRYKSKRIKRKQAVDVMLLGPLQFWGEASLLSKQLLRYEKDGRMSSDSIDTTNAIYMSDKKHNQIADIFTVNQVSGYILQKENLPFFIDITTGTRVLRELSSLYNDRRALLVKRIERENDTLRLQYPVRGYSNKPQKGELYVLPSITNVGIGQEDVLSIQPPDTHKKKRKVLSYRSVFPLESSRDEKATRSLPVSPIRHSRVRIRKQPKISPIKTIRRKVSMPHDQVSQRNSRTNLDIAGEVSDEIDSELEDYIGNAMYMASIQGTSKSIEYPTNVNKKPIHSLELKPLVRRLRGIISAEQKECEEELKRAAHLSKKPKRNIFSVSKGNWLHLKSKGEAETRRQAMGRVRMSRSLKTNDKVRMMLLEGQLFQERYAGQYYNALERESVAGSQVKRSILDPFGVLAKECD